MSDPIVDEVREVREAVAREYGYDVKKLADALREQHDYPRRLKENTEAIANGKPF